LKKKFTKSLKVYQGSFQLTVQPTALPRCGGAIVHGPDRSDWMSGTMVAIRTHPLQDDWVVVEPEDFYR